MSNYSIFDLLEAKALEYEKLEEYTLKLTHQFLDRRWFIDNLRRFCDEASLDVSKKTEEFLLAIILSIIWGDIGGQQNPFLREKNCHKINKICLHSGLNINVINNLSVHQDEFIKILSEGECSS